MNVASPVKINSLSFRLAAGAALWITAALVVTGLVLSGLFRDYVERDFERQMAMQLDRLDVGPRLVRLGVRLRHRASVAFAA